MSITIQNLSKSYGGNDIFTDFSLDMSEGMRLCVCGANGTGKSTLLRIMAGDMQPDAGRVIYPRGYRIGYVEQILDDLTLELPLSEWVQSSLPHWEEFWTEWEEAHVSGKSSKIAVLAERQHELEIRYGYNPEQRAQTVLSGLGFSVEKWKLPLKQLSGGWRERAKLARVLTAGADLLLLDEPTNHLDLDAVEWLEEFLLSYKGILIFVAHDRVFMDHIGTHILYLGGSKPFFRKCSFSRFLELQEELEEQRTREAKQISAELSHKMDFVRRFKAKATKARQAASKQKQAKRLEKELEQYKPEQKRRELSFKWPEAAPSEKVVLTVTGLAFHFNDGVTLWSPLTFSLFRGQKIGLVGHNGSGKSTLLKILSGKVARTGGSFVYANTTRMGYYSQQQTETVSLTGTVLGEMRRLSDPHTTEEELMSVLGLFLLGEGYFDRDVSSLSGGELSRLTLALLFLKRCNLLILDEPTNHLDLESRDALTQALEAFEGTLLIVAHDRYLLSETVDEIWSIDKNGITVFEDGFEQYEAARKLTAAETKSSQAQDKTDKNTSQSSLTREEIKRIKRQQAEQRNLISKQIKPLQEEYKKWESELETVLEEHDSLEKTLASPGLYEKGNNAGALLTRFSELTKISDDIFERLGELETKIHLLEEQRTLLTVDAEM